MDTLKSILSWLKGQNLATKILAIIIAILVAVITLFTTTSCSIARSSISGDRVVDKNVRDSVHYSVEVQK